MSRSYTIYEQLVGTVLFPLSNFLMNRRHIRSNYRSLIQSQWYPEDALREIRFNRLKKTIAYAYTHVPFYRQRFLDIGLEPGDITDIDDLNGIPPLSRQELIDNRHILVDERLRESITTADRSHRPPGIPSLLSRIKRNHLIKNTSSGSTGAPTIFYEDGSVTALNWALEQRTKQWFGILPGSREGRMYRFPADFKSLSLTTIMRKTLWNQLVLPGSNLTEEDLALCLREIKKLKPRVLWGFTAALTGLAGYIRNIGDDVSPYRPTLCISWAAPLYDHEERLLKEVFDCDVTNIYGTREVGHIAARCPSGSYHINDEYYILESEKNDQTDADQQELLVTTLNNTPMPFIRYRTGDMGKVNHSTCECGRSLHMLTDFQGRTGEIFITGDGHMISPNFWCRTFMAHEMSESVRRFQIIYKRNDLFVIRIIKNSNFTDTHERYLRTFLNKQFGLHVTIVLEYVNDIAPEISGKYRMVINETETSNGADHAH